MSRYWFPPALLFAASVGLAAQERPVLRVVAGQQPATAAAPAALTDEEALKQGKLDPKDGPALVGYLKQRTLSDADQGKIRDIIKKFAADDFEIRLKAGDQIAEFGPAAIGPLKTAEKDSNAEVAYRASLALKKVSAVNHSAVAAAAARAVVKLKPPGAAGALLGFLPLADSDAVADDIRTALVALAVANAKAEPALVAALTDASPVRRSAAYVALIEGGPAGERVRLPDAYPLVREAVRKETDLPAKLAGVWALVTTTRDKEFVPELIDLLPKLPRGRAWQAEDLLLQIAGSFPPGAQLGKTPAAVAAARDGWRAWWDAKGGAVDLSKLDFKARVRGLTELVETDTGGLGRGRLAVLGPDMQEKWRMVAVNFGPQDMRLLPNDRVLVPEVNFARVTEREIGGRILRSWGVQQAIVAEPMPDDGVLVIARMSVTEFDKQSNSVWQYSRNNGDIYGGRRLPNGDVLVLTSAPQGPNAIRLDAKGKETGKTYTFGRLSTLHAVDVVGADNVLVCETEQVAEYELKTGKLVWKHTIPLATSAQRLPNGNTLIAVLNQNKLVEVTPTGNEVWEFAGREGLRISRAYRR